LESVWTVSKLSTESVGSHRELVANCVHNADADATKQFRRVGVGGVCWALKTADVTYDVEESVEMHLYVYDDIFIRLTTRKNLITVVGEQIREQPLTGVQTICVHSKI